MLKRNKEETRRFIFNLIIIFVMGLASLLWFKGGFLIKSEDVGLPLNFSEWKSYAYCWFNQRAAGTYPIDNFAALFFLALPALLQKAGLTILAAQKIHFIFWFLLPGFCLYYLLVSLFRGKHPPFSVTLCAVGFYMFNLYLEPVWLGFNIANLSAYAGLPLFMGFFINGLRTRKFLKYVSLAGVFGLLLSGAGVNPPVAYVCLVAFMGLVLYNFILSCVLKKEIEVKYFLKYLSFFVLVIVLVNAFWMYPQGARYLKSSNVRQLEEYKESIETGYQGIIERSKYTSLLNVLRMQGAWTWYEDYENDPYVLYSEFYQKNKLFLLLGILPALCAFLAVFFLKNTRYAAFFILTAMAGIVFSVGMHYTPPSYPVPPLYPEGCRPALLALINKFLLKTMPGFWLVRTPWYKWSILTTLGFAVMIGVFVKGLILKFEKRFIISKIVPLLIFACIIVYAYPVLFGKMFTTKEQRTYIPPNLIKIPSYVYDCAGWFSKQKDFFRIMVLPSTERRITDWGYVGYEPIISYFTEKPIITPVIEGTFGAAYAIPNMDNLLYKWLYVNKTGSEEELRENVARQNSNMIASKILPLFNIKYLLYEKDIRWGFYDRFESPDFLRGKLALQKDLVFEKSFEKWDIYRVENELPHIYGADRAVLVNADIGILEPLSRTDFFDCNLIFAGDLPEEEIAFLREKGVLNKTLYSKFKTLEGETCSEYFLFSTENENVVYKKETPDKTAKKHLEVRFGKGTFLKNEKAGFSAAGIRGKDLPLEVEILNKSAGNLRTNFKCSCRNLNTEKFLHVYLNEEFVKAEKLEVGGKHEIELPGLNLKPGANTMVFITSYECSAGDILFEEKFGFYTDEFNLDINLASPWFFYVHLYPYPVNDIDYLKTSKQIIINGENIQLVPDKENSGYKTEKEVGFKEGVNQLNFLQNKKEKYYVLIEPAVPQIKTSLIRVEILKETPVFYKLRVDAPRKDGFVVVFNEAFDEGWQAFCAVVGGKHEKLTTHFPINGYANAWYVDAEGRNGQGLEIVLKYVHQNEFLKGMIIAVTVFVMCGVGYFLSRKPEEF